ncbi:hypothetical protein DPMN_073113 [Dreissena polymorpha]|uniref:Uncharacterized protein n=1 Tax=Dreissena polymorpha TaxID=45954 RepID=A0A9D4HCS5_DREPO|nr:hypothetical protein DPMN_073113 [Dreissena polymorpha]
MRQNLTYGTKNVKTDQDKSVFPEPTSESKYIHWRGQWRRSGNQGHENYRRYDQSAPRGQWSMNNIGNSGYNTNYTNHGDRSETQNPYGNMDVTFNRQTEMLIRMKTVMCTQVGTSPNSFL